MSASRKPPARHALEFEVCILAGGLSQRMGRDKSRLRLGARTMLGEIKAAAKDTGLPVRVIRRDAVARCGPLGGVFTALQTSGADAVVFLACDMPFVTAELLRRLLEEFRAGTSALFVRAGGQAGFPFVARCAALPVVAEQIVRKEFSLQQLVRALKAKTLRLGRRWEPALRNINTPADWKRAGHSRGTGESSGAS